MSDHDRSQPDSHTPDGGDEPHVPEHELDVPEQLPAELVEAMRAVSEPVVDVPPLVDERVRSAAAERMAEVRREQGKAAPSGGGRMWIGPLAGGLLAAAVVLAFVLWGDDDFQGSATMQQDMAFRDDNAAATADSAELMEPMAESRLRSNRMAADAAPMAGAGASAPAARLAEEQVRMKGEAEADALVPMDALADAMTAGGGAGPDADDGVAGAMSGLAGAELGNQAITAEDLRRLEADIDGSGQLDVRDAYLLALAQHSAERRVMRRSAMNLRAAPREQAAAAGEREVIEESADVAMEAPGRASPMAQKPVAAKDAAVVDELAEAEAEAEPTVSSMPDEAAAPSRGLDPQALLQLAVAPLPYSYAKLGVDAGKVGDARAMKQRQGVMGDAFSKRLEGADRPMADAPADDAEAKEQVSAEMTSPTAVAEGPVGPAPASPPAPAPAHAPAPAAASAPPAVAEPMPSTAAPQPVRGAVVADRVDTQVAMAAYELVITIDSHDQPLAAWQVALELRPATVALQGAVRSAQAVYLPPALGVVGHSDESAAPWRSAQVASFAAQPGATLPSGRVVVARVSLQAPVGEKPTVAASLMVALDADGQPIPGAAVKVLLSPAEKP